MKEDNRSKAVRIVEVGPRDGLQNEKTSIPLEAKRDFIKALADSGLKDIEVGAFVRPDRIPQMADSDALAKSLKKMENVTYWALVPNLKGAQRALDAGLEALAVFTAASETFSQRNTNMTRADSLKAVAEVAKLGHRTRAYVSTCFACPYEGKVSVEAVSETCKALLDLGVSEISVGDTIGAAVPSEVEAVFSTLLKLAPAPRWAGHFHDTRGMALANVLAALNLGVTVFDASAGGLGGCPFAPGASGNLATEDLLYMLEGMGAKTGVDLGRLLKAAPPLEAFLGHSLPGKVLKAGLPRQS